MINEQWTLLLVKERAGALRQISISASRLRKLAWAGAVAAVLFVIAFVQIGVGAFGLWRTNHLADKNQVLLSELSRIEGQVAALEATLDQVREREREVSALAGLKPIDDDVMQVGVGGLGSRTPESNPLFGFEPSLGETAFALDYDVDALNRRAGILLSSLKEAGDSLSSHRDALLALPTLFPTAGSLTSRFSRARLHPIMNEVLPHPGVDIAAPRGTPILATGQGRVTRAGWSGGYGQMVEIDHGNGYSTLYAHASRLLVRAGQTVERGDVIAQVGRTGTATSSHLHYEVRLNGQQVNPTNFFLPGTLR
jgi:murein DD-endopeptidase MepM/ murein hydrolase activator NlpD